MDLELYQMDIVAAYLIGDLEAEGQEIYIRISEGADIQQECTTRMYRVCIVNCKELVQIEAISTLMKQEVDLILKGPRV